MNKVYYVDGACGSRKTTKALEFAGHLAKAGEKILFVQPTMNLIQQSSSRLRELYPELAVLEITSQTSQGTVQADLTKHLKNNSVNGEVLFITHKTFLDIEWFPNQKSWHVIIDEIPEADFQFDINVSETWHWALNSLKATECDSNLYLRLCTKQGHLATARLYARNLRADDLVEKMRPLFHAVESAHWTLYVNRMQWNSLGYRDKGQLNVHGHLNPSVIEEFASVRLMGANVLNSLLFRIWSRLGIVFIRDKQIVPDYEHHDKKLGSRICLYYFSEHRWSKTRREKLGNNLMSVMKEEVKSLFGGEKFLWVANNDIQGDPLGLPEGQRISNISHGDNNWRDYNNVVFLSALNPNNSHFSFLNEMFGLDAADVHKARAWEIAYQCIMRSSLRVPEARNPVRIIVPDIALASYLAYEIFPGAQLSAIAHPDLDTKLVGKKSPGRRKKEEVASSGQRSKKSRERGKLIDATKTTFSKMLFVADGKLKLSFEQNVYSMDWIEEELSTADDLRNLLHEAYALKYTTKEANLLISGAQFNPDACNETQKGLANVVGVTAMMLDFDGGTLSPREVTIILTDIQHLIYNSFNNGKNGQVKFRVVIPFSKPASPALYHHVWDLIAERLRDAGYSVGGLPVNLPASGLDKSKRCANSWFYMPCRAKLGARQTFWMENWSAPTLDPWNWSCRSYSDETEHHDIAFDQYVGQGGTVPYACAIQDTQSPIGEIHQGEQLRRIEVAETKWAAAEKGDGNVAFFKLARTYKSLGMSDLDIRSKLGQQVHVARSRDERRKQIPSILKSLKRRS